MNTRRVVIDEDQTKNVTVEPIKTLPNGQVEVTLTETINAVVKTRSGGEEERSYSVIKFRPMSFGDIKAMANIEVGKNVGKKIGDIDLGEMDMAYWLVQRLSDVPAEVLDKVDGDDMQNCIEAIGRFFPSSQTISKDES